MYIGLGTKAIFSLFDTKNPFPSNISQGVFYCFGTGVIYEGGVAKSTDCKIDTGDTMTIVVNLKNNKIGWNKNNFQFHVCGIPSKMTDQRIFLMVRFYYRGD